MKKILVVDDEPALAELIADFCRGAGFEVRVLTESVQALAAALEFRPDLITLDIEMPGLNGVEVLQQLQARSETRGIPVVVISVVAKRILEQGRLDGAQMVFEKPVRFQRMMALLQGLLGGTLPSKAPVFEPTGRPQ